MLEGLMQHDHPLTLQHVLWRMRTMNGHGEVVTLTEDGSTRITYADLARRVDRLCAALRELGVGEGDRVATFAWNSQRHLELYLAVPAMGAVLHTLNVRLFEEQLTYIANHAQDKLVFVDDCLTETLARVAPSFETVERYVVMGDGPDGGLPDVLRYEALLDAHSDGFDYPEVDERQAAGLCYTSGTTGNPKGVLYSHRSNVLHTLGMCLADSIGVTAADRVLPIVPLFHANAWGFPYACAMTGASMVMPSRFIVPDRLAAAIAQEGVTISAAVPTVWLDLLRYADENEPDLSSVHTVICGGAAVPQSLMEAWEERHGVRIFQAWGMTETSPLASVSRPLQTDDFVQRARQGRPVPLLDVRLIGGDGEEVPWDGESTGELEVRGPWIASAYYEDPSGDDKFHDGWLRTGDIASIDEHGSIRISDRSKDVIKSGGEWISSVELESALIAHPAVAEAAVIAKPDERWTERPLACVVLEEGCQATPEELRAHLEGRVAKWWVPDDYVFIDEVPKTSVGKFDKKVLRGRLQEGALNS
jgi:fatty-acyl-CoA synthase